MTPEQWEIHQDQQAFMFRMILTTAGVKGSLRETALETFKLKDTWSGQ